MPKWRTLPFLAAFAIIVASTTVAGETDGVGQWQILTKLNFSSQIRLHPHILLLVSVPWSGESRALMRDVTDAIVSKEEEFGSLKLMYMHRNSEKMLADAIGASATEGLTVLYYHSSLSYRYKGKLNARNILSSIRPYLPISNEDIPLKRLSSVEEVNEFVKSTDKAVILHEFCGWTAKLLAEVKKNESEIAVDSKGFDEGRNGSSAAGGGGKENLKGRDSESMTCGGENGFGGIPWIGGFSSVNDSVPIEEIGSDENSEPVGGVFCSHEEFQRFESFFPRFMTVTRELFLPPERHRFGLVSEKLLSSPLGVQDYGSWSVVIHFKGCPSCSMALKEGDDLERVIQMDTTISVSSLPVLLGTLYQNLKMVNFENKLDADGQDVRPTVPAKRPSMLLFVDRSSDLSETKRKSEEALDTFRDLALHYTSNDLAFNQNKENPARFSVQSFQEYRLPSMHPKLKLSPTARKIKLKDKMSIMIVNEGRQTILGNIASDLQGSSLNEILTYVLQKQGERKLSSVAKEMGFQLLSNDLDIKVPGNVGKLPVEAEVESKEDSVISSKETLVSINVDLHKDPSIYLDEKPQTGDIKTSFRSDEVSNIHESSQPDGIKTSSQDDEEKTTYVDESRHLLSTKSDQLILDHEMHTSEGMKEDEKISSNFDNLGETLLNSQTFEVSFFFSDGDDRLLRELTGDTNIPSLVAIDPSLQQHHVFPKQEGLNYRSMEDFLHRFLNGSLLLYQRSESDPRSSREGIHPPFVNMDFHEADSIPKVAVHSFTEQVLGFNQSDNNKISNAWNEDVLVLFGNSWCGFCQRMDLVVREVYRAIKGYMNILKSESGDGETVFGGDNAKSSTLKLPKIYRMDCTLNDCSWILRSLDQREVYPALLFFPAETKTGISYEGALTVAEVVRFMADHGSNSRHLTGEKVFPIALKIFSLVDYLGIISTASNKRVRNHDVFLDKSPITVDEDALAAKDQSLEVLLKNLPVKTTVEHEESVPRVTKSSHGTAPRVMVGSILVATEKLPAPFDKSMILIVKADQSTGFQGLIYNKPLGWDSLHKLEEELEVLKEAPLSFGGPLINPGLPLVSLTRGAVTGEHPEVAPGVYFLDQLSTYRVIEELKSGNHSLIDYWFFLGFSSWSWDQLFDEIALGAWNLNDSFEVQEQPSKERQRKLAYTDSQHNIFFCRRPPFFPPSQIYPSEQQQQQLRASHKEEGTMLDINLFREDKGHNPEIIRESQRRRFASVEIVDEIIELDKIWRQRQFELDNLRKDFNKINKKIAQLKIAKEDASEVIKDTEENKRLTALKEAEVQEAKAALYSKLETVGNLVHDSVPVSNDEANNAVIRQWGEKRVEPKLRNHVDLVELLGIADTKRGANVAGGRGFYLKGFGVRLNQALINFGLEFLAERGYTELQTPFFMRKDIMAKCAQLAQFDEELYKVTGEGDDKYLIATAEQPLCSYHLDDWIHPTQLPIRYAGYSSCFRKEAGSHGRDTLGIFRVHQFEKVEQFCLTSPNGNDSWEMHEEMIKNSEDFYKQLNLPYQIVAIVSGALNDAAAKKYDLEAWFPASQTYRELVSCSNCTDYQSRKLEIRYGQKKGNEQAKQYVHLLNSTLTATERTLCCILENYQKEDGVVIPEVLRKYVGGRDFLPFQTPPAADNKGKKSKA
ncbi:hypothetical protein Tsubulata_015827 [Turnera subulata]|uniref:serine--tRNA ligase n=1 Tax=Turnera subulata TaxID=218843 RepID=A0A9Q0J031_9ROSI|nr:hypothetical protein Tsubulata_015827 [Turnera subulata]